MPHRAHYQLDGEIIPSVNDVTGLLPAEGLVRWRKRVGEKEATRIMREARNKGTKLAEAMEAFRKFKHSQKDEFRATCLTNWNAWFMQQSGQILDVECHLVNTLDKYHGSPDVVLGDSRGNAVLGDDKVKKRFADYRLLMNEHAYAMCDSIEKADGSIVPVSWQWPIRQLIFWTYDPDTGEMYPSPHEFDSRVYKDFLTLRNVWDINARAEEYFKEHATLLPSQRKTNVTIASGSDTPHPRGFVSDCVEAKEQDTSSGLGGVPGTTCD